MGCIGSMHSIVANCSTSIYLLCIIMNFHLSFKGLERAFSAFGLVHTKLRNRLGNERVMKLVKTYCHLRDKESDDVDNFKLLESGEHQ